MSTVPVNALAAIIARAAATLPRETGATQQIAASPTATKKTSDAGGGVTILADVSSSMLEMAGARRRIDILDGALRQIEQEFPDARRVAFAAYPVTLAPGTGLPEPHGGTALHSAIDHAAKNSPSRLIVICDGEPDDEPAAIRAAMRLRCPIDVIYCGDDRNRRAIDFMRRLAVVSGGSSVVHDMARSNGPALVGIVRRLALSAPAKPR